MNRSTLSALLLGMLIAGTLRCALPSSTAGAQTQPPASPAAAPPVAPGVTPGVPGAQPAPSAPGVSAPVPPAPPVPPTRPAEPPPERRMLADSAGEFEVKIAAFLEPGAEPTIIRAAARRELILGGRFLVEHIESLEADKPFAMMTTFGFNEDTRVGSRIEIVRWSTMSSATMPESGKWDPATRTLLSKGEYEGAGVYVQTRVVEKRTSADTFTTEFHAAVEGFAEAFGGLKLPETRTMTLEYTRVRR